MRFPSRFPTNHDMILAYRKVKAELWWMRNVPSLRLLAEYEDDLIGKLRVLREKIHSEDFTPDTDFLGGVTYLPKKLKPKKDGEKQEIHFRVLSDSKLSSKDLAAPWGELEHRIMAIPSIDFQILGVLWTMEEGGDLDAARSAACRANVLRRIYVPEDDVKFPHVESTLRGPINKRYPGVFKPYFQAYKDWRNDGLKRAQEAVDNGQRVFAITLDLQRFYHQIDANCLKKLFPARSKVATAFYRSLEAWQKEHGETRKRTSGRTEKLGIPVGLIASGLVANLVLKPLDEAIQTRLSPIYYGRYVDDLFVVLSLNGEFRSGGTVLKELERLLHGDKGKEPSLKWLPAGNGDSEETGRIEFQFRKSWLASRFESQARKQRIFLLEGKPGRDLLAVIDRDLKEHSSEWRMVPDLADDDDDRWLKEALVANHDAAEGATTLRRADDLSVRRMGIAVALRKLEAIERFGLRGREWQPIRAGFYRIATAHVFSPDGLCDFWPNIPRLFGLIFSNGDWSHANRLLSRLIEADRCFRGVSSEESRVLVPWLTEALRDELLRSCRKAPQSGEAQRFFKRYFQAFGSALPTTKEIEEGIREFKAKDLDRVGHRIRKRDCTSADIKPFIRKIRRLRDFLQTEREEPEKALFHYLFPTRPLGELEICLLRPGAANDASKMRECLFGIRGQSMVGPPKSKVEKKSKKRGLDEPRLIDLSPEFPGRSVRVAITNYLTAESSWEARVRRKPDLSIMRLQRLILLIDDFIRNSARHPWKEKPLYFCLPELSVPKEWVHLIAGYFSFARISLLAGVEYEEISKNSKTLRNSAYLFLRNRDLGYPTTYLFRQYKTRAAPGEAQSLWQEGNFRLGSRPARNLPVYKHGNFYFGILLCSELTDTELHHHFRGHVDALFCLEWNPDVDTFSSLVEATAQTVHAFIIQVNNRRYGDSRIRVPAKQRFMRDLVQIRGGDHDYFVVGNLPIGALRGFQRKRHSDLSGDAAYKPLPSGYIPENYRRLHKSKGEISDQ